jgi:hypothetical protein
LYHPVLVLALVALMQVMVMQDFNLGQVAMVVVVRVARHLQLRFALLWGRRRPGPRAMLCQHCTCS